MPKTFIDTVQVAAYGNDRLVLLVNGKRYFYGIDGQAYGPMVERLKRQKNKMQAGQQVSALMRNLQGYLVRNDIPEPEENERVASMEDMLFSVNSALMALKYLRPDIDPLTTEFSEFSQALTETGKIPPGITPERFAAMCIFYIKNQDEVKSL